MLKVKPMLAYKAGKKPIDFSEQVFIQRKLDGVRCLFTKDGAFSRTGKPFKNVQHLENQLAYFFKKNPDIVLDGELYNHALKDDFEKIISLVRKQKPTDEDRGEASALVQFWCYDLLSQNANAIANRFDYATRMNMLTNIFDVYDLGPTNAVLVKTREVESMEEARIVHEQNLAEGFEGSIIRLNKPYQQKRSYHLQKFKDFHDTEATIIDYVEGKGKRTGTLGKFIMRDEMGIQFGCPPGKGFTYKDLANILDNIEDYIGKVATFTYFERTKMNSYRHPQFKCLRDYE
tara:strand:- start:1527 stop:2393 length:867 start_codon:yes stop_codon:yes gene_type:complete